MSEALDLAWDTLLAARHACATGHLESETRRQLALAIVECARNGTRERVSLSVEALKRLFPLGIDGQAT